MSLHVQYNFHDAYPFQFLFPSFAYGPENTSRAQSGFVLLYWLSFSIVTALLAGWGVYSVFLCWKGDILSGSRLLQSTDILSRHELVPYQRIRFPAIANNALFSCFDTHLAEMNTSLKMISQRWWWICTWETRRKPTQLARTKACSKFCSHLASSVPHYLYDCILFSTMYWHIVIWVTSVARYELFLGPMRLELHIILFGFS